MIKTAIRLSNDMVMVFGADGEQIPEYQGQYHDIKASVLRVATEATEFFHWPGLALKPQPVSPDIW